MLDAVLVKVKISSMEDFMLLQITTNVILRYFRKQTDPVQMQLYRIQYNPNSVQINKIHFSAV